MNNNNSVPTTATTTAITTTTYLRCHPHSSQSYNIISINSVATLLLCLSITVEKLSASIPPPSPPLDLFDFCVFVVTLVCCHCHMLLLLSVVVVIRRRCRPSSVNATTTSAAPPLSNRCPCRLCGCRAVVTLVFVDCCVPSAIAVLSPPPSSLLLSSSSLLLSQRCHRIAVVAVVLMLPAPTTTATANTNAVANTDNASSVCYPPPQRPQLIVGCCLRPCRLCGCRAIVSLVVVDCCVPSAIAVSLLPQSSLLLSLLSSLLSLSQG